MYRFSVAGIFFEASDKLWLHKNCRLKMEVNTFSASPKYFWS